MANVSFKCQMLEILSGRLERYLGKGDSLNASIVGMAIADGTVRDDAWWESRRDRPLADILRELSDEPLCDGGCVTNPGLKAGA